MRSQRTLRYKQNQQKAALRTNKRIAAQQKKEEFFEEVIEAVQNKMSKKDLEFLFQNIGINRNREKRTKKFNQLNNQQPRESQMSINKSEEQPFPKQIPDSCKKANQNLFQMHYKEFILKNKINFPHEGKQYTSTPIRQSINFKQKLPKRLFQVDQKMRKNYERIKQRIIFVSPEDSFRATNSIRNQKFRFHSKTQRNCRYKTECLDSQNKIQPQSIPRMLLGDLNLRMSYQEQIMKAFETTQKRLLCFKRNERSVGELRRRYKLYK